LGVNRGGKLRVVAGFAIVVLALGLAAPWCFGARVMARLMQGQAAQSGTGRAAAADLAGLFAEGEAALRAGDLERAAAAFK
jgi:hypothetical protein